MMQYFRTTSVELVKIFRKKSTYIFVILLSIIAVSFSAISYYTIKKLIPQLEETSKKMNEEMSEEQGENFEFDFDAMQGIVKTSNKDKLSTLETEKTRLEKAKTSNKLEYNDIYYKNVVRELAVLEYKLDNKLVSESDNYTKYGFSSEDDNTLGWENLSTGPIYITLIFVILACILSMQTAGEFENGTIKSVLMKPGSRAGILMAKFTAVLLFGFILQIFNYFLHLLSFGLFFGFGDPNTNVVFFWFNNAHSLPMVLYTIVLYLISTLSLIMPLSLVLFMAILSRSNAATIASSLAIYMLANKVIIAMSRNYKWLRFSPFVHMNLENYLFEGVQVPGTSLIYSMIVSVAYTVTFLIISNIIFAKRDI